MECIIGNRKIELEFEGTAAELLSKLGIGRESVIVKANGRIIPETERIGNSDSVEIMKVIYGG